MKRLLVLLALFVTPAFAQQQTLASAPSRYATLDDARVHYKQLGRGRTVVVFVHGWASDMAVWRDQAPHFAKRGAVIAIDLPGHGGSDAPRVEYTMRHFARAVRAVLDHAKVSRAILVGHSMGTQVVREVDRLYPTKVRALVAVDGALRSVVPPDAIRSAAAAFEKDDWRTRVEQMAAGGTPRADASVQAEVKRMALATPQHVLVSMTRHLAAPEAYTDEKINVPLLVINAQQPVWSKEYEQSVRELARDVDYQTIAGIGHFLMMEKPADFNARLEAWLTAKGFYLAPQRR